MGPDCLATGSTPLLAAHLGRTVTQAGTDSEAGRPGPVMVQPASCVAARRRVVCGGSGAGEVA